MYAGASTESASFTFIDDKLVHIWFKIDSHLYDSVIPALMEKYGKPKIEKEIRLTNRFGAIYTGTYYEWKKGGSTIRAQKYMDDLRKSLFEYSLGSYDDLVRQERDKTVKDRAKNL